MYFVYVLRSLKDGKLYIGYTGDLEKRIQEHNDGITKSTAYRRPLALIYYEASKNIKDAMHREKYLPRGIKSQILMHIYPVRFRRNI